MPQQDGLFNTPAINGLRYFDLNRKNVRRAFFPCSYSSASLNRTVNARGKFTDVNIFARFTH
jgi:hypothetical protein